MKQLRTIDNRRYRRYKSRNMYIEDISELYTIESLEGIVETKPFENREYRYLNKVYSYDTLIGYIDYCTSTFYTWGYGKYSTTTSRQITMLCNEEHLTRKDI